eukprot:6468154-Amphidinium_carterae.1
MWLEQKAKPTCDCNHMRFEIAVVIIGAHGAATVELLLSFKLFEVSSGTHVLISRRFTMLPQSCLGTSRCTGNLVLCCVAHLE